MIFVPKYDRSHFMSLVISYNGNKWSVNMGMGRRKRKIRGSRGSSFFRHIVDRRFHGRYGRLLILQSKPKDFDLLLAGQLRETGLLPQKPSDDRPTGGRGPLPLDERYVIGQVPLAEALNQRVNTRRDIALVYQTRRGDLFRMLSEIFVMTVPADQDVIVFFPAFTDDQQMHAILRGSSKFVNPLRNGDGNSGSGFLIYMPRMPKLYLQGFSEPKP
ncbi:hypothetical protein [Cohnella caldifontis]|uniref:hypothetical protein n=1 Tax=Cohnella caldifontis TaxID=3027471 RepID=UPI0023EB7636|nr:hypothetical protein [Cohnella sp. YIM B05605]